MSNCKTRRLSVGGSPRRSVDDLLQEARRLSAQRSQQKEWDGKRVSGRFSQLHEFVKKAAPVTPSGSRQPPGSPNVYPDPNGPSYPDGGGSDDSSSSSAESDASQPHRRRNRRPNDGEGRRRDRDLRRFASYKSARGSVDVAALLESARLRDRERHHKARSSHSSEKPHHSSGKLESVRSLVASLHQSQPRRSGAARTSPRHY